MPEAETYDRVAEIVEVGWRACNYYLEHGYILITVMPGTKGVKRTDGQFYVRRDIRYILGRTPETERAPEPVFPDKESQP